jgi:hypothetical protein
LVQLEASAANSDVVDWSPVAAPRPLTSTLTYPGEDPTHWTNSCLAGYVGREQVIVRPAVDHP